MEGLSKSNMSHISVVIPVLNEETLIDELVKRVKTNIEKITKDFEIIIVDDGSDDETWNKVKHYALEDIRIKGIKFSRNFGHHYAITSGLNSSSGDWVVVMDGDLQDRPEVIPSLYQQALEGFEVVFVSRVNRPEKMYYKILQKIFYRLLNLLSGLNFDSSQANFSIIKRNVVQAFNNFPENSRFYVSTIKWLGFKSSSITADHGMRFSGRPSYTLSKRFKLASDIILAFSNKPLRFIVYLGLYSSIASIIFAFFMTFNKNNLFVIPDERSMFLSILVLIGGCFFLALGILGIYIGNIYTQVKNRPLYVVSEKINL